MSDHAVIVKIIAATLMVLAGTNHARAQKSLDVSSPQGITLSIYDTGTAIINEARRVSLEQGEHDLVIRALPNTLDPVSASYGAVTRSAPFDLLEQSLHYDLTSSQALLNRMAGQPVVIQSGDTIREGVLLSGPIAGNMSDPSPTHLPVRSRDSRNLWMIGLDELSSISFPFARESLATEPRLIWRVRTRQEGPQNFRLVYRADGLDWRAFYEIMLDAGSLQANFSSRVRLINESGAKYVNARVRLLLTEKGLAGPIVPDADLPSFQRPALRYAYGMQEPGFERSIAALAPVEVYELPRTVTLDMDRPTFVHLVQSSAIPIRRFFVYDGVRFDRYQRNRRTDWNYGTEFHNLVHTHVEFENEQKYGLGMALPPGVCRVYQVRADGSVDMIGEEIMPRIDQGGKGHVRVGPARGLSGERERTGYVEVKPHHVYEESFQIRLSNTSEEAAEIRVVEHLYRWSEFQIVRADADFVQTGPQTIEFRADVRPGGRRSIHYTVRYTW
ncbi:MAG TPA: hypothetical protein PJ991_02970 [Kiritimatiellia bacterium]|nr:hypothetical protein [Kiritimatiellia bacterium]